MATMSVHVQKVNKLILSACSEIRTRKEMKPVITFGEFKDTGGRKVNCFNRLIRNLGVYADEHAL